MNTEPAVIDCDGHILEPPDLWEKYLEPAIRDRAIRIRVGDDGYEYFEIDGRRAKLPRAGQLGTLGGMGKQVDEARRLREGAMRGDVRPEDVRGIRPGPEQTYLRGAAFGTMDMKERIQLLDILIPIIPATTSRSCVRWSRRWARRGGARFLARTSRERTTSADPRRAGAGQTSPTTPRQAGTGRAGLRPADPR